VRSGFVLDVDDHLPDLGRLALVVRIRA